MNDSTVSPSVPTTRGEPVMATLSVLILLWFGLLAACEKPEPPPPPNTDPRKGSVVTSKNCFLSKHCFIDRKVCVGSDLLVQLDVESDRPTQRWVKDAKECQQ